METLAPRNLGRPAATSHALIEQTAFVLFARQGFERTTLDEVAAAVGVGRRTLFRYYASKNDIPWGRFDQTLHDFRALLAASPRDLPVWEAVHRGVVACNDVPPDAHPPHDERMRLILETPALRAHSVLRYAEWRGVVADFVAGRLGLAPTAPLPLLAGQVSLACALAAYDVWLRDTAQPLTDLVAQQVVSLRAYLGAA